MTIYYSPHTNGFYHSEIHGDNIPENSISISEKDYRNLLEKNASGEVIYFDGKRIKTKPYVTTIDEIRSLRNLKLKETDWSQGADIPAALKKKWAVYRKALRDLPESISDPSKVEWPEEPN